LLLVAFGPLNVGRFGALPRTLPLDVLLDVVSLLLRILLSEDVDSLDSGRRRSLEDNRSMWRRCVAFLFGRFVREALPLPPCSGVGNRRLFANLDVLIFEITVIYVKTNSINNPTEVESYCYRYCYPGPGWRCAAASSWPGIIFL